jgi:hypothetical protein
LDANCPIKLAIAFGIKFTKAIGVSMKELFPTMIEETLGQLSTGQVRKKRTSVLAPRTVP